MKKSIKKAFLVIACFVVIGALGFGAYAVTTMQRLQEKVRTFDAGVERWSDAGQDSTPITQMVAPVAGLMAQSKIVEAEALIDAAIAKLDKNDGEKFILPEEASTAYGAAEKVAIDGYDGILMEPFLSPDGKLMFFNNSNEPGTDTNLYIAERTGTLTFKLLGELKGANTNSLDAVATMDRDNNFIFTTLRKYADGGETLYTARFDGKDIGTPQPLKGVEAGGGGNINMDGGISRDGNTLYISRAFFQPGATAPLRSDLLVAVKDGDGFKPDPKSAEIMANINTPGALEYAPEISPDGLTLYFNRANGLNMRVLVATRPDTASPFGAPQRIAAGIVEAPTASEDGSEVFFHKRSGGKFRLFRAARK